MNGLSRGLGMYEGFCRTIASATNSQAKKYTLEGTLASVKVKIPSDGSMLMANSRMGKE